MAPLKSVPMEPPRSWSDVDTDGSYIGRDG